VLAFAGTGVDVFDAARGRRRMALFAITYRVS
jgi:hypothetical protein